MNPCHPVYNQSLHSLQWSKWYSDVFLLWVICSVQSSMSAEGTLYRPGLVDSCIRSLSFCIFLLQSEYLAAGSQNSTVSIVTKLQVGCPGNWCLIPVRSRVFLFCIYRNWLCGLPGIYSVGPFVQG
jgi:hypothetical protein